MYTYHPLIPIYHYCAFGQVCIWPGTPGVLGIASPFTCRYCAYEAGGFTSQHLLRLEQQSTRLSTPFIDDCVDYHV